MNALFLSILNQRFAREILKSIPGRKAMMSESLSIESLFFPDFYASL